MMNNIKNRGNINYKPIDKEKSEDIKRVLKILFNLGNEKRINPSLHNINNALKEINKIYNKDITKFNYIHITGTNGKGTTAKMIYDVIKNSYKVGLYTSPHLLKFNERIRINDKLIENRDIIRIYKKIEHLIERYDLTFFESTTLISFIYFIENNIDFLVLEVGMGGLWDATNIIKKDKFSISILTRINDDHNDYLGNLKSIVKEKSGIIKDNSITITLSDNPYLDIIKQRANKKNNKLIFTSKNDFEGIKEELSLNNIIFKENLCLAYSSINEIKKTYNLKNGTNSKAFNNFNMVSRFEFREKNIIFDGAHNPNGINWLIKKINEIMNNFIDVVFIFGCSKDKDYKEMINLMSKVSNKFYFIEGEYWKAQNTKRFVEHIKWINKKKDRKIESHLINKNFNFSKLKDNKKILYVFTGSLYLLGELYELI